LATSSSKRDLEKDIAGWQDRMVEYGRSVLSRKAGGSPVGDFSVMSRAHGDPYTGARRERRADRECTNAPVKIFHE
jgi:hypothetical protein